MNEKDHERLAAASAMADHVAACCSAILQDHDAETVADLARTLYRYTAAGVALSVMLADESVVYDGDKRQGAPELVPQVVAFGVSSIVEGSDAEVDLSWLPLSDCETPADAVARFNDIVADVNDEACRLWDEAHAEE